jgi:hypothetical protein
MSMSPITGEVVGIPAKLNEDTFSIEVKTAGNPTPWSHFVYTNTPEQKFPEIMPLTANGKVVTFAELLTWFHASAATVQVHLKPIDDLYGASVGGAFTRTEEKK